MAVPSISTSTVVVLSTLVVLRVLSTAIPSMVPSTVVVRSMALTSSGLLLWFSSPDQNHRTSKADPPPFSLLRPAFSTSRMNPIVDRTGEEKEENETHRMSTVTPMTCHRRLITT